jgi:hypothetical protein
MAAAMSTDTQTDTQTDTDADSRNAWFDYLRTLTGTQRSNMAAEMSDEINEVCRAGIRARHPEYSPEQVNAAFLRIILGDELVRAVLPNSALIEP